MPVSASRAANAERPLLRPLPERTSCERMLEVHVRVAKVDQGWLRWLAGLRGS
jgi:hypothetical protein